MLLSLLKKKTKKSIFIFFCLIHPYLLFPSALCLFFFLSYPSLSLISFGSLSVFFFLPPTNLIFSWRESRYHFHSRACFSLFFPFFQLSASSLSYLIALIHTSTLQSLFANESPIQSRLSNEVRSDLQLNWSHQILNKFISNPPQRFRRTEVQFYSLYSLVSSIAFSSSPLYSPLHAHSQVNFDPAGPREIGYHMTFVCDQSRGRIQSVDFIRELDENGYYCLSQVVFFLKSYLFLLKFWLLFLSGFFSPLLSLSFRFPVF